jgi:DNA-binding MarR family transcriptional regulator
MSTITPRRRKPSQASLRKQQQDVSAHVPAEATVENFDLHNAPGHLLRRCHSRARAVFDDVIGRQTGLSKQQMALLLAIAHFPAATHAQLSEETGFDRNTLADTLNRLITKGFALRQRSQVDGRAYDIQLTPAGAAFLEPLIPLAMAVQARIIEPLPEELRPVFIKCLRILAGVDPAQTD